ncbi:hypothetical protein WA026_016107 [Henosepilachna vigintioctopunctata]|uniref:Uncharacterized protein n=1 Tax=Henosepilachna vigintioctopunctata TaxID=420089 RepID=A0AAW1UA04_9CUCU
MDNTFHRYRCQKQLLQVQRAIHLIPRRLAGKQRISRTRNRSQLTICCDEKGDESQAAIDISAVPTTPNSDGDNPVKVGDTDNLAGSSTAEPQANDGMLLYYLRLCSELDSLQGLLLKVCLAKTRHLTQKNYSR